ncbi:MAG: phosphatase PAP2 family protein [Pseudomonadota bacterium]
MAGALLAAAWIVVGIPALLLHNNMDMELFRLLNGWLGQSVIFDKVIDLADSMIVKSVPFMVAFWGLWFWNPTNRAQTRNALVAMLFLTVPLIGITRAIADHAPFSHRPFHTEGLEMHLQESVNTALLDGWSSMPSDHASLFMGLAVAFFCIHRVVGAFLVFWAMFLVSVPRIIVGFHWPSDIMVGWLLGVTIVILLLSPATKIAERSGIVPYFEDREAIGYPLLFIATYEVARMFENIRKLIPDTLS